MTYKSMKLKPIQQKSKRGLLLKESRPTEYAVMQGDKIIAYIPDWYRNNSEIAAAIAEILNKNRTIKFDLKI